MSLAKWSLSRLENLRQRRENIARVNLTNLELQFLPEALELEHRDAHPATHWVLRTIIGACALALVWSFLADVDVIATAPGKVVPEGELKLVQASDPGRVREIVVREGQSVRQGDLLVALDPTSEQADMRSALERKDMLIAERARVLAELEGQPMGTDTGSISAQSLRLQQSMLQAHNAVFVARLAELSAAQRSRELNLLAAKDALHKLESSLHIAQEKESRVRNYVGTVISRFEYLKLKDELGQLENDVAYQHNTLKAAERDTAVAEQQVQQAKHDHRSNLLSELSDCDTKLASLSSDVQKATKQLTNKQIYAPVSGIIHRISINSSGQVVAGGQTLLSIVPSGTPSVIEAFLSNEDVGFVRPGQNVDLKVDAYPFARYGMLRGVVLDVSPDADEKVLSIADARAQSQEASTLPTKAGLSYKLRIKLLGKYPNALDVNQIKAGMTVQADIKTDRRRIIDFVIEPLASYTNNGLTAR